jgi:hypothetical protein
MKALRGVKLLEGSIRSPVTVASTGSPTSALFFAQTMRDAHAPVGENNILLSDPRLLVHLQPTEEASIAPELGLVLSAC